MRALVRRQLPVGSGFIMAQNIDVAVAVPDFHAAIVGAVPLVDVIDHFDHPAVETKSPEPFGAAFVHIGFDLDLHGVLAIAMMSSLAHRERGPKVQDPRHLPVEPESPPGCSDRMATGPSAMLHR